MTNSNDFSNWIESKPKSLKMVNAVFCTFLVRNGPPCFEMVIQSLGRGILLKIVWGKPTKKEIWFKYYYIEKRGKSNFYVCAFQKNLYLLFYYCIPRYLVQLILIGTLNLANGHGPCMIVQHSSIVWLCSASSFFHH